MLTMKSQFLITPALAIVLFACNPGNEKAVAYNDKIVELQDGVVQSLLALDESFVEFVPEQMDAAHAEFVSSLANASDELNKMGPYKDDSTLFLAAGRMFSSYQDLAQNNYAQFIELLKVPDSLFTAEMQAQSFDLKEVIDQQRVEGQEFLINAQEAFASKHGFYLDRPKD